MSTERNSLFLLHAVREKRGFEARTIEIARGAERRTERYNYVLSRATTEADILIKVNYRDIISSLEKALQSPEISSEQQELLKKAFMQSLRNSLSRRIATEYQKRVPELVRRHQFKEIIIGLLYDFLGLLRVATKNGFTFKQSVRIAGKAFLLRPASLVTLLNTYPQIPREVITVAVVKRDNPRILLDRIMNMFDLLRSDTRFICFDDTTLLGVIAHYPNSSEKMLLMRLENKRKRQENELEKINEDPSNNLEFWWNQLRDRGMVRTALLKNYLTELDVFLIIEAIVTHRKSDSSGFEVLLDRVSIAVANLCD